MTFENIEQNSKATQNIYPKNWKNFAKVIILFLLGAATGSISNDFYRDYKIDHKPQHKLSRRFEADSNIGVAHFFVSLIHSYLSYVDTCERFPEHFSDMFRKIDGCGLDYDEVKINGMPFWIDPWGRPYQIRFDRNKRKLMVRSRGRYLWTSWDDIENETTLGNVGQLFNDEIKKCEKIPDGDLACIFNRGWY